METWAGAVYGRFVMRYSRVVWWQGRLVLVLCGVCVSFFFTLNC